MGIGKNKACEKDGKENNTIYLIKSMHEKKEE